MMCTDLSFIIKTAIFHFCYINLNLPLVMMWFSLVLCDRVCDQACSCSVTRDHLCVRRWQCCSWTRRERLTVSPPSKTAPPCLPSAPWPAPYRYDTCHMCFCERSCVQNVQCPDASVSIYRSIICPKTFKKTICNIFRWDALFSPDPWVFTGWVRLENGWMSLCWVTHIK